MYLKSGCQQDAQTPIWLRVWLESPFCFHLAHISLEIDDIDDSERVFEGVDCELKKDRINCLCTVSKILSLGFYFSLFCFGFIL